MFIDKFNTDDPKDLGRLFSYLEKDKFNSLSYDEQDELLDFLLDCSEEKTSGSNKITTIGIVKGSNSNLEVSELIEQLGRDKIKDIIRSAIASDQMYMDKVDSKEISNILERVENGTASNKDIMMLEAITKGKGNRSILTSKSKEDVDFSTFAIIKAYCSYFHFKTEEYDTTFLKDIEPVIDAAYCVAMASIISDKDCSVGKMFAKHGYSKVQKDITSLTSKFTELIIDYSKDNNIMPEKTFLALLNVLRLISEPLNISLDNYDEDTIEETLLHILFAETTDDYENIDDFIKENMLDNADKKQTSNATQNDSDKNLANANKKESKNNKVDVRKLLLDD